MQLLRSARVWGLVAFAWAGPALAQPPEDARINGIGGFFFRSQDREALVEWYFENLGVAKPPSSYDDTPWTQEAGITIFHPFPEDTAMFAADKAFMLNFRTSDLDALVAHIRSNGVDVEVDETVYPNGRFAHLVDPEGNPIQLWEPAP